MRPASASAVECAARSRSRNPACIVDIAKVKRRHPWRAMLTIGGEISSSEIVPVPAAMLAKIFLAAAPIDCLTIQHPGPDSQCTLVGHGGRNDTTGSKGRVDCCVARSDRSIAASTRTVRRARPSGVASVRQDPNSVAPGVLFCCTSCLFVRSGMLFSLSDASIRRADEFEAVAPAPHLPGRRRREMRGAHHGRLLAETVEHLAPRLAGLR
jgi:hypothetical protein